MAMMVIVNLILLAEVRINSKTEMNVGTISANHPKYALLIREIRIQNDKTGDFSSCYYVGLFSASYQIGEKIAYKKGVAWAVIPALFVEVALFPLLLDAILIFVMVGLYFNIRSDMKGSIEKENIPRLSADN